jgi:putative magnesium chelatase accessory protein
MTLPLPPIAPATLEAWRARWPNGAASAAVEAAGLRWHVQRAGAGRGRPVALLVHGTAGATHAWHAVLPRLAEHYEVVAPDLPGHGFTEAPPAERLTLPGMAADLAALVGALAVRPRLIVGHSAGAAVLLRMALDGALPDARLLVGLNAAIVPPPTLYRALAGPRLRALFTGERLAGWAARHAGRAGVVEGLLRSTGSRVPPAVQACYEALTTSPGHVRAALTMMAQWDVPALLADVHRLRVPALFLAGADDRWVPARHAERVAAHVPGARFLALRGHGHLMHEEAGDELADHLLHAAEEAGCLEGPAVAVHAGHGPREAHDAAA